MNGQQLRITRTFNAPIGVVWEAFSKAEHISKWWAPKGFTTIARDFSFTPGGKFHYGIRNAQGPTMWGLFVYREIEAPTRLVFTNAFSNEEGEVVAAPEVPFGRHWPLEILNHITLEDRGTTTTMQMVSYPADPSAETVEAFNNGIAPMEMAFNGLFDQLEAYLATIPSPAAG